MEFKSVQETRLQSSPGLEHLRPLTFSRLERMGLCSPLARISVELLSGMLPIRSSCVLLKQDRELFTLSPSLPMDKP